MFGSLETLKLFFLDWNGHKDEEEEEAAAAAAAAAEEDK